jgi:proteasome lid subunit RPN8/RPN11
MLRISHPDFHSLRRHGEETYPHECCGILLGKVENDARTVEAVVRAGNTRTDSPHNRYHIDPRELVAAQRKAREQGWDIVGFYHSHPDHPPQWSATDLAEAHWLGCSHVIISVEKGGAALTKSFVLLGSEEADKRFQEEAVEVVLAMAEVESKPSASTSIR